MIIAVVEDHAEDREALSFQIHKYMEENQLAYTIIEYHRAEDFVESLTTHTYSIVFFDIYMDQMTGMEAAKLLRKKDKDCKIIFVTTSLDFVLQGYSVNASHYLLKPITEKNFQEAMENCNIKPQYAVPYMDLSAYGGPPKLETKWITHISLFGRTVHIHTTQQVFKITGAFSRVTEPLLDDNRFLLCIQGVMVNMDYISSHEDSLFILKNGTTVPINMRNRKRILQHYRDYMFEHIGGVF